VTAEAYGALREIGGVLGKVEAKDKNLADQLRRAATSVVLHLEEGAGNRGGNRRQRYLTAAGSAQEARAALRIAEALGYLEAGATATADDQLDHVAAVLHKLTS